MCTDITSQDSISATNSLIPYCIFTNDVATITNRSSSSGIGGGGGGNVSNTVLVVVVVVVVVFSTMINSPIYEEYGTLAKL